MRAAFYILYFQVAFRQRTKEKGLEHLGQEK